MLATLVTVLLSGAPLAEGTCDLWQGSMWGNDPNVKTRMMLCRRGNTVCGELAWSGRSGENVRELKGHVDGDVLLLSDERFLQNAPRDGWVFCLIDRYTLKKNPTTGALEGRYVSKACRDEAKVNIKAVARPEQPFLVSCFDRSGTRAER
ncbi:MAG: hypothetical protein JNK82_42315 [Myxococcaceae bacterium]|nr:hypothetical protein [Myxococcaceae bacterium]